MALSCHHSPRMAPSVPFPSDPNPSCGGNACAPFSVSPSRPLCPPSSPPQGHWDQPWALCLRCHWFPPHRQQWSRGYARTAQLWGQCPDPRLRPGSSQIRTLGPSHWGTVRCTLTPHSSLAAHPVPVAAVQKPARESQAPSSPAFPTGLPGPLCKALASQTLSRSTDNGTGSRTGENMPRPEAPATAWAATACGALPARAGSLLGEDGEPGRGASLQPQNHSVRRRQGQSWHRASGAHRDGIHDRPGLSPEAQGPALWR